MAELAHLQTRFQHYLLDGGAADSLPIVGTQKVSIETRAGIYYEGYRIRLREALGSNYPCLQSYLGEASFNVLADAYINERPSTFRSIRWFGDQLPQFLQKSDRLETFWLSELADLEWKMAHAFDAADQAVLTIEAMAQIAPESWSQMCFTVHPSLQRFTSQHNIVEVWQNLTEGLSVDVLKRELQEDWVIWRRDNMNRFYLLEADECCALDALIRGDDFSTICADLCTVIEEQEVITRAASLLKGWIQSGLLATIS